MSFTRLRYHVVFATKHRRRYIKDDVEPYLYEAIETAVEDLEGHLLERGGVQDHVHLVVAIRPTIAVSDFVGRLKSHSSRQLSRRFAALDDFSWQSGFGAFTLWPERLHEVCDYVRRQKEHHRRETLWDLLENFEP